MTEKRILILTTGKGGGHKSSSDAIKAALEARDPRAEVRTYEALRLFPGYHEGGEQGYISFTTRYRFFWKVFFEFTSAISGISAYVLSKPIYPRLKKLVNEYEPDLILSVHPCFVGSVRICLKRMKCRVPFCACIVDLVRHSHLWRDKKCDMTFVPTEEMYALLLSRGFEKEKLVYAGFPVKQGFGATSGTVKRVKSDGEPFSVLMVNPSTRGNQATLALIEAALCRHVKLTVVTGSDALLKAYLEKNLAGRENLEIEGYVRDMEQRLADADVLVTKAGPNMMLESVRMCVPVIITGCIPGQEEENFKYITAHEYGMKCDSPDELGDALDRLFADGGKLLERYSQNERGCKDTNGAETVAKRLLEAVG